jgi:hypothetical protein
MNIYAREKSGAQNKKPCVSRLKRDAGLLNAHARYHSDSPQKAAHFFWIHTYPAEHNGGLSVAAYLHNLN